MDNFFSIKIEGLQVFNPLKRYFFGCNFCPFGYWEQSKSGSESEYSRLFFLALTLLVLQDKKVLEVIRSCKSCRSFRFSWLTRHSDWQDLH